MKKLILFTMAFAFLATPARADLVLTYDMPEALVDYTVGTTKNLVFQDSIYSDLILKLVEDTTSATLDSARVNGGANFDLMVDLTMTQLGTNDWSAAGTLKFTDTVTGTNAVEAAVQSYFVSSNGSYLEIKGYLGDLNPPTILVNRGDPWVFVGNGQSSPANADGTANQITMYNPGAYDGGEIITLKFGWGLDVDTFFGETRTGLDGGEVKGQVVPVPAGVLLGMLGLCVAGLKLRKFA